jgi:hypothetical protein
MKLAPVTVMLLLT